MPDGSDPALREPYGGEALGAKLIIGKLRDKPKTVMKAMLHDRSGGRSWLCAEDHRQAVFSTRRWLIFPVLGHPDASDSLKERSHLTAVKRCSTTLRGQPCNCASADDIRLLRTIRGGCP